jgi:hypothetical protein
LVQELERHALGEGDAEAALLAALERVETPVECGERLAEFCRRGI